MQNDESQQDFLKDNNDLNSLLMHMSQKRIMMVYYNLCMLLYIYIFYY